MLGGHVGVNQHGVAKEALNARAMARKKICYSNHPRHDNPGRSFRRRHANVSRYVYRSAATPELYSTLTGVMYVSILSGDGV